MRIRRATKNLMLVLGVTAAMSAFAGDDASRKIVLGPQLKGTPAGIPEKNYVVQAPGTGAKSISVVASQSSASGLGLSSGESLSGSSFMSRATALTVPALAQMGTADPATVNLDAFLQTTNDRVVSGTSAPAAVSVLRVRFGDQTSVLTFKSAEEKERYLSTLRTTLADKGMALRRAGR